MTASRLPGTTLTIAVTGATASTLEIAGREKVSFVGGDYLGVGHDPRVIDAGIAALRRFGTTSLPRAVASYGTIELERELAEFMGMEACLLFPSGFMACESASKAISAQSDLIFVDEFIHPSITEGVRRSHKPLRRLRHNDFAPVTESKANGACVLVESLYSGHNSECDFASLGRALESTGAATP